MFFRTCPVRKEGFLQKARICAVHVLRRCFLFTREELRKINRIIDKEFPDAHRETLVVLDGTTGQNALAQAKQFGEVADITGIILTKLDGTAKGGIAIAIQSEMNIPVKYIGIGEKIDDLQKFDADAFVDALFENRNEGNDNDDIGKI